jgi:hypothetical protein
LGNGIGSSNGRFQPLGASREEIGALLRERQVSAGRMHDILEVAMAEDGLIKAGFFFYGFVEYRDVFGGVSTWAWGFEPGDNGRFAIAGGAKYNYRKYDSKK